MNPIICQELKKIFPNVILDEPLKGTRHIDLTVDNQVAIEVKKIESNTSKDEIIGQLIEDMRIKGYQLGIAYGIDQSATNLFIDYNGLLYRTAEGIIKYVIVKDPYKKN